MSTIKNLADFIEEHGGETPYYAGRCLYKYTDCGPWVAYLIEEEAERVRSFTFAVGLKDRKISVVHREEGHGKDDYASDDDLTIFGFHGGKIESDIARSVKEYRAKVKAFYDRCKGDRDHKQLKFVVHECDPRNGEQDARRVWISCTQVIPAKIREVYYESKEANEMLENCVGIKMGSIVEGSEAYVDRDPMMFPFESKDFEEYVEGINDEASFYWKRDNEETFQIEWQGKQYWIDYGWGSDMKLPKKIKAKVEAYLEEGRGHDHYDPVTIAGGITITQMDKGMMTY